MFAADFVRLDLFFDPGGRPRRFFLAMGNTSWGNQPRLIRAEAKRKKGFDQEVVAQSISTFDARQAVNR